MPISDPCGFGSATLCSRENFAWMAVSATPETSRSLEA